MTGARATRRVTVAATDLPLRPGAGAAPPLVLRHGVGSNAASWGAMLAVLDPRMEAMAWDAPGYGNSTPLTAAWPRAAAYATRLEAAMAAVRPAGYAQAVRALGSGNLLADAPHIRAPTLVAVGAEDVVTSPAGARAVFAALGHGQRLVGVPDTGHALPQEAPGAAAALLQELTILAMRTA